MRIIALIVMTLCLSAFAFGQTPATQPAKSFSDSAGAFSVRADEAWQPNAQMGQAAPTIRLAISRTGEAAGIPTSFVVLTAPTNGKPSLEILARAMVERARQVLPDQGDAASVHAGRLDGEDARVATYLLKKGDAVMYVKSTIARHQGTVFVVQVMCDETRRTEALALGNAVLGSFTWTRSSK